MVMESRYSDLGSSSKSVNTTIYPQNGWREPATIVFVKPAGATVKIRYGSTKKYFGKDRQKQRIEANKPVLLKVGSYSAVRARVQIYVEADTEVTYYVYPGGVNSVTIPF